MLGIVDDLFKHAVDRLLPRRRKQDLTMVKRLHRFIARTARREEHDGRGQMFIAKSRESDQPDESREA